MLIEDEELDRLKSLLDEASEILQKCYTDDVLSTERAESDKQYKEAWLSDWEALQW